MKKIFRKLAVLTAIVLCLAQTCQVSAAENSIVTLKDQGIDRKQRTIQVTCVISGAESLTNGKIRILYDSSQLHLKVNEKGELVSNALCEMNDCINGNKEEGEIVIAFASAEELPAEGCLTTMTFELGENVKAGDVIAITTNVEKLAGNNGDVTAEKKDLSVTVPEKDDEKNSGEDGKVDDKTPSKEDGKESGQGETPTPSKDDEKESGQGKNVAGKNSSNGQSGSNKQSSTGGATNAVKTVKTGDTVNVLCPVVMMIVAGVVIIGIIRKRKSGHHPIG